MVERTASIAVTRAREKFVSSLKREQVISVYSGRPGCACGCRGKHTYLKANQVLGSKRRGYKVDDDEVNDRSVAIILNKFKARQSEIIFGSNNIAIETDTRLLIVYPVDPVPSVLKTRR